MEMERCKHGRTHCLECHKLTKPTETSVCSNELLRFGDVVIPLRDPLRSGCSEYTHAVVVSTEPLALVSERADMRWGCTVEASNFKVVGTAKKSTIDRVLTRLEG